MEVRFETWAEVDMLVLMLEVVDEVVMLAAVVAAILLQEVEGVVL